MQHLIGIIVAPASRRSIFGYHEEISFGSLLQEGEFALRQRCIAQYTQGGDSFLQIG